MTSPPANGKRSTTQRDRLRRAVRQRNDPCHICGTEIDYSLPYLHPGSFVVDHVMPLAKGGLDNIANAAAAHRSCNRAKSDKLPGELRGDIKQPLTPVVASPIW